MSERLTPESLVTIRREAAPRSVTVRLLLAELDAVTRERDEVKSILSRFCADRFVAAAIRASFPDSDSAAEGAPDA